MESFKETIDRDFQNAPFLAYLYYTYTYATSQELNMDQYKRAIGILATKIQL